MTPPDLFCGMRPEDLEYRCELYIRPEYTDARTEDYFEWYEAVTDTINGLARAGWYVTPISGGTDTLCFLLTRVKGER